MARGANVSSVEAIEEFKGALAKFADAITGALAESEGDAIRLSHWLTSDRLPHWQRELRKRQEAVAQARSELFRKKLAAMDDERAYADDQKKALERAKRAVEEAEQKIDAVRRCVRFVDREYTIYKGSVRALDEVATAEMPRAIAQLILMMRRLAEYASLSMEQVSGGPAASWTGAVPGEDASGHRYAHLRKRAPDGELRARALATSWSRAVGSLSWSLPEVGVLAAAGVQGEKVDLAKRVVIAIGAFRGTDLALVRNAPEGPEDSGWTVTPLVLDADAAEFESAPLGDVLSAVPSLAEFFEFHPGTAAVLVAGMVESILDASDNELWQREPGGEA